MRSTGERYLTALCRLSAKNRRRYGGYMTHLALVLLFVGFTGKAFTDEVELVLNRGETVPVGATSSPTRQWLLRKTPI